MATRRVSKNFFRRARLATATCVASVIAGFASGACGGDETPTDEASPNGASTVFVAGPVPPTPPLAPGAGPPGPNPNLSPNPDTKDAGPVKDAASVDSAIDAPKDATGQ